MKRLFLLLPVVLFAFVPQTFSQELATDTVRKAMTQEWINFPRQCLEALKLYGDSKADLDMAVAFLQQHQDKQTSDLYHFAATKDPDGFFKLLAGAVDSAKYPPDCAESDKVLVGEFATDVKTLVETSETYRKKGEIAGMSRLLAGLFDGNGDAAPLQRVMGCYSVLPLRPFQKINEILGVK
jgi:hypothetical protein